MKQSLVEEVGPQAAKEIETLLEEMEATKMQVLARLPPESLSVRQLAKLAGITPSSADRFRRGKQVSVPVIRKLVYCGAVRECPCCGSSVGRKLDHTSHPTSDIEGAAV